MISLFMFQHFISLDLVSEPKYVSHVTVPSLSACVCLIQAVLICNNVSTSIPSFYLVFTCADHVDGS